ncbi:LysR family transcriptional regulator [Lysinibacillus sp. KU-BSD001]|uniref:LysR family transcriptional regulator n=1 Tax=Lysinibacillus sp. KU-BSD001 TaxID=3141328 RepID=UPI0036E89862
MIETLKVFTKVYELQNFTKASEILFISQPTISMKIKQLEKQLQVPLFIRQGPKHIQPTPAATYLYEQAVMIIEQWEKTEAFLQHGQLYEQTCTMVCSNTFGLYYLPSFMPQLTTQFPSFEFTIDVVNSEQAIDQLMKREADFAFIEKPIETTGIDKKIIFQDELVLAGQLDSNYWLMREKHSGIRYFNELYIAENNIEANYLYANHSELIIRLLQENIGKSIVSKKTLPASIPYMTLPEKYNRNMYWCSRSIDSGHPLQLIEQFIAHYFHTKKQEE